MLFGQVNRCMIFFLTCAVYCCSSISRRATFFEFVRSTASVFPCSRGGIRSLRWVLVESPIFYKHRSTVDPPAIFHRRQNLQTKVNSVVDANSMHLVRPFATKGRVKNCVHALLTNSKTGYQRATVVFTLHARCTQFHPCLPASFITHPVKKAWCDGGFWQTKWTHNFRRCFLWKSDV